MRRRRSMILPRACGSLTRRREPLQIFTSAATSGASSQFGGSRTARRVLAEARAWCDEARGRQSKLAAYLGVSRQAISAWFREAERKHPRKRPTAEQVLALEEFLQAQRVRQNAPPGKRQ